MRRITEYRGGESAFDESVQGLVRNAPWWMVSLVVHGVVLLILGQVIVQGRQQDETIVMQVPPPPDDVDVDVDVPEEKTDNIEEPIEIPVVHVPEDDEVPQADADIPNDDTAGDDGLANAPFTGPSTNTSIGPGGGAGGGNGMGGRTRGGGKRGGTPMTERAVEAGLRWLADHQDVETTGGWDCDEFMKHDPPEDRCDGPGKALYDPGVSGLALLAFLGAGYTDRGTKRVNPFATNVRKGLRYLITIQDEDGCFGSRQSKHFIYNHAIACLAMTEAWAMTRNPRYRRPAQEGLNFLSRARNGYLAWRYGVQPGDNDTSVTGWAVMALKSGKFGGLDIDPDAFEGARTWINKMTDPEYGQVGYTQAGAPSARPEGLQDQFPSDLSQSMTSVGVLTRIFLGENPKTSEMIRKGTELCLQRPPRWEEGGHIDMYYWYYGTLALYQVGGAAWKQWNRAMVEAIVKSQHRDKSTGSRRGSWDPIGPWGPDGGRVYSTALMVMCLEVYYRYDRILWVRRSK